MAVVTAGGYGAPVKLGDLGDPAVKESSGLAASRRNPGRLWTHNDSGDGPLVYCLERSGASCGVWRVEGARAVDWEDMAAGPGPVAGEPYLYLGDIGDNARARNEVVVYRVAEPEVPLRGGQGTKARPAAAGPGEALRLRYPDGPHDAEALLVHPASGDLYIVAKELFGPAGVYRAPAPLAAGEVVGMQRVAEVAIGLVTGGDIAPDGSRVALCSYTGGFELALHAPGAPFDTIWQQRPA
ncbi:MAG: hypothetical protein ACRD0M_03915, partial [Acidimicrobiales bacterium]